MKADTRYIRQVYLAGCISEGKTKDDALKNIKEAIELYLEPVR